LKIKEIHHKSQIMPKTINRQPCPLEVPPSIAEDYNEACLVLSDSPKASAALSRRCLQNLLRDAGSLRHTNDLNDEIQKVLDSHTLPTYISSAIDSVRNVGNFAAHPIKCKNTGEILPVDPEEAEWTLDVLESLFDFYYVQPKKLKEKRAKLDGKLARAGKRPMK